MTGWNDDRMTGWQDDWMTVTEWQSDRVIEWQDDRKLRRRLTGWYILIHVSTSWLLTCSGSESNWKIMIKWQWWWLSGLWCLYEYFALYSLGYEYVTPYLTLPGHRPHIAVSIRVRSDDNLISGAPGYEEMLQAVTQSNSGPGASSH